MRNREQSAADQVDQALTWIRTRLADVDQPPPRNGSPPAHPKASKAYQKWFLRAAIPILGGLAWVLKRTGEQVITAAGVLAAGGAVTAAVLLTPDTEPAQQSDRPPTSQPPTATDREPIVEPPSTTVPSTAPPPTAPPTPAPPASPEPSAPAPPPSTPVESTSVTEEWEPQRGRGQEAPLPPAPAPPPPRDDREEDDGNENEDDDEDRRDNGRRTQCFQVLPEPETDINACVAAVAELAEEVTP